MPLAQLTDRANAGGPKPIKDAPAKLERLTSSYGKPDKDKEPVSGAIEAPSAIPDGSHPPPDRLPEPIDDIGGDAPRRTARRRPAAPSRDQHVVNEELPSIGGLIYALNQRPSNRPFVYASAASGIWAAIVIAFALTFFGHEVARIGTLAGVIQRPELLTVAATLVCPILLIWFLAFLVWRTEELRLRSTAMTEVAIRLAEPDRMAEQSVASLGQSVRRQVSFMNDAVERALGRAGELETLVHREVAELERSYEDNERKIRGLINEIAGERNALLTTSGSVSELLKDLGGLHPDLIEKLAQQQFALTQIIDGASKNLTALETSIAAQAGNLEAAVGNRTEQLQVVLEEYTDAIGSTMDTRTEQLQGIIADQRTSMDDALTERTEELQGVFEEYTRALDSSLANRAEALDIAFNDRLRLFDESIMNSTKAIEGAVAEKALAMNAAMESHAQSLGDILGTQANQLDENLMQGIHAVRRTSENITRQSIQAIEGLSRQSDLLQQISQNLLSEINTVTQRFENQGKNIMQAANALENANYRIDNTLQTRQAELETTLENLSDRTKVLGNEFEGYSSQLEGSLTEAEKRARMLTTELSASAQEQSRAMLAEIERLKQSATEDTSRALEELRNKFSSVSDEVSTNINTLTSKVSEASTEARRSAAEAANLLESEQQRLRAQIDGLPATAKKGSNAVRQALQDQLRAFDQLSNFAAQQARQQDITPPSRRPGPVSPPAGALPPPGGQRLSPQLGQSDLANVGNALDRELRARQSQQPQPLVPAPAAKPSSNGSGEGRWSLRQLLNNASLDEDAQPAMMGPIDIASLARAIDPNTASAIWSRLGSGQQGIMVRSIYTPDGRQTFDEAQSRYRSDPSYQNSANTYITDFENLLEEAENKDPSGRTGQQYLISDVGRAYLVLAHAIGRIT